MTIGTTYKPTLVHLARALSPTSWAHRPALAPSCDDCQLPAVFRTAVPRARPNREVRVHQCLNCAKIIWGDE